MYEEEDMIERGNSLSKLFYYGEKVQAWAGGERRERGGGEGSNMGGGEGAPYQKTQNWLIIFRFFSLPCFLSSSPILYTQNI